MAHRSTSLDENPLEWIVEQVQEAVAGWIQSGRSPGFWREPLVAVASAADPLFMELKRAVAGDHALPDDLLAGARSVVAYFLPFKHELGQANATEPFYASRSWAEAYTATNALIAAINQRLQRELEAKGRRAAVTPATHNFDEERLISRWSHKHVAYIAGLGTFGHNRLLITRAGCCGRLGSFVTDLELPPTARPDTEWCLTRTGRKCLACAAKCRFGALTEEAFNRHTCYAQLLRNDAHYDDLPLVDVCGKCSCEVPCSHEIPKPLAGSP